MWTCGFWSVSWCGRSKCTSVQEFSFWSVNAYARCCVNLSCSIRCCFESVGRVPYLHLLALCLVGTVGSFCLLYGVSECTSATSMPFSWCACGRCGSIQEQFCLSRIAQSECSVLFCVFCLFPSWTYGCLSWTLCGRSKCESIQKQCCSIVNAHTSFWVNKICSVWGCPRLFELFPCFHFLPWCLICIVSALSLSCGINVCIFTVFLLSSWCECATCGSVEEQSCLSEFAYHDCLVWFGVFCFIWSCLVAS